MLSLSGFTPSADVSTLQLTEYRTHWIDMACNALDQWRYDDGYAFGSNWVIYGGFEFDTSVVTAVAACLMLSESADGDHDLYEFLTAVADHQHISVYYVDTGAVCTLHLTTGLAGVETEDTQVISEDYRYRPLYFKLVNTADSLSMTLHKRPDCTDAVLYTLGPVALAANVYDRLWAMNCYLVASANTCTGWSGGFYINESLPATNIPPEIFHVNNFAIPFKEDDLESFTGFPTSDLAWTRGLIGTQDFTAYAQTDPSGVWATTATRCTGTAVPANEDSYVTKDFGAAYFSGDFRHYLDVCVTNTGSNAFCVYVPWALSDDLDDTANLNDALLVQMYWTDATHCSLRIQEVYDGTVVSSATIYSCVEGTAYYLDIYRDDDEGDFGTFYCDVYASAALRYAEGAKLGTEHIHLSQKNDYQYLHCGNHGNYANVATFSAYCENLRILQNGSGGTTGIVESGGTVVITGMDDISDAYATAAPTVTGVNGGMMQADVKVTSLENNEARILFGMTDTVNSRIVVVYVEDVGGTKYFRIGKYEAAAWTWSTSTAKTCTLNTTYKVLLVCNPGGANAWYAPTWHFLFVDEDFVEHVDYTNAVSVNRLDLGCLTSAKMGGTVELDNLKYLNDIVVGPTVCRGGLADDMLIYTCLRGFAAEVDFFYSLNNMESWTWFATPGYRGMPVWNPEGKDTAGINTVGSWWLFYGAGGVDGYGGTDNIRHCRVYEITTSAASWEVTDWTADVTFTLRKDFDEWFVGECDANHATIMTDGAQNFVPDSLIGCTIVNVDDSSRGYVTDNEATTVTVAALTGGVANTWVIGDHYHIQKNIMLYPTREIVGSKLVAGGEYLSFEDGDDYTVYLSKITSLLFNFDNADGTDNCNPIESEYCCGNFGDVAGRCVVEPTLWFDTAGLMNVLIRNTALPDTGSVMQKYRESGEAAPSSDWDDHPLLEPGRGMYETGGNIRMFAFRANCWTQGRRFTALADFDDDGWYTLVAKVNKDPDASDYLPISALYWWPANSIGANGALDARTNQTGWLVLDYASALRGLATVLQLTTGEWISEPGKGSCAARLVAAGMI